MRLRAAAVVLFALVPLVAHAQGTPPKLPASTSPARVPATDSVARRDSLARRDSARRDSLVRRDSLRLADTTRIDTTTVRWADPDSIMKALMARPGYDVTRFQGTRATYDAGTKHLRLDADSLQRAAVEKEGQVAVSDSSIFFNQTTGDVTNLGHYIISMPGGNEAPIRGFGQVTYNSNDRSAVFTNANLPINNGSIWYLHMKTGGAQVDSTQSGAATIYIDGLSMTSCPDSEPDYHFNIKTAKRTPGNTVIGRDVTMYVGDIPVIWLPFIFQNVHGGRSSGLLTTKVGISDIIKNSPSYHRDIENLGYYWAMNDYMDAKAWIDWRSGAGGSPALDPGRFTTNVDYEYTWLNQFLGGVIGASYTKQGDGHTNLDSHWAHSQQFSHNGQLRLDIHFVTSTDIQRRNTFDPQQALATISSSAQYSRQFGPATLSIGGTRTQYPGRPQVDQSFPTLTLSTSPLNFGSHVTWTPGFSFSASQSTHIDQQGQFQFRYTLDSAGRRDSVSVKQSSSKMSMTLASPLKVFNQDLGNSFSINSSRINFPEQFTLRDMTTGDSVGTRIYSQTYTTGIDWTPSFQLPPLGQNRFNLSPVISLANVDGGPFWIATERTNGRFVSQAKRLSYGLNASPTLYARFSGFGPLAMFRHSITPTFGYTYAPASHVDTAYLAATGQVQKGYLGNIALNQINFGLSTALEAKVAARNDTTSQPQKLKVLSLTMSSFSYNLSRLHDSLITSKAWWRGLTTESFNYSVHSDLLPGIEFSSQYSLFQGSTSSDTAIFKPYQVGMSASLNLSRDQNPFTVLAGLFGRSAPPAQHLGAAPADTTKPVTPGSAPPASQPTVPSLPGDSRLAAPASAGWHLSLTLSSAKQRPPVGGNVITFNPAADCAQRFQGFPFQLQQCLLNVATGQGTPNPITSATQGGPVYRVQPQTNVGANLGFNLTPKWTVGWNTNYDFVRHDFAEHVVSLQRDLHDWIASFNFSQSPNGNFAFSFSIGLKAQHDLKFDYARSSVRSY